jgi:glycogen synthase
MNLLFISNEYPPDTGHGGIGTYTLHAAEGMALRGHGVQVICRSASGKNETTVQRGVTVHRAVPGGYPLPQTRVFFPLRKLCYRWIPQSLVRLAWAKTVAQTYSRLIDEGNRFDIIEYPECGAEGWYLSHLHKVTVARLHTPWEIVHRCDALKEPFPDVLLQSYLERSSVRRATAVSSPSRALAERMTKRWSLPSITVYPNGLPLGSYPRSTGTAWVYVGRVERRKGVHVLLDAYAAVCARHDPPPLQLIGKAYGNLPCGKPYGEFIRERIALLRLDGRVTWIEGVANSAVREHLSRAAAAFFPSLWENFPYACLEAMACGLAVVASSCGGFPEMIQHGSSGLLVAPNDDSALAAAMERLLHEPNLPAILGEGARSAVANRFDQGRICAKAEEFYKTLLPKDVA